MTSLTNLSRLASNFLRSDADGGFWMLGVGLPVWMVLNSGALLFGVYFPPIWRNDPRIRLLRFRPGSIPIIAVATPLWICASMAKTWKEDGAFMALGPFVLTVGLAMVLFVGTFCGHRLRRSRSEPVLDRRA
jgi:hypothetical protein